jgi:outer membrane lipoprotein-sorting protein
MALRLKSTYCFAIILAVLFFTPTVNAETAVPTKLSEKDRADIVRIERYLNDLKTLQARFLQISTKGGVAEGKVYLSRPGKLRFEYDPPTPILIVSSGLVVTYYDRELEQVSEVFLRTTPISFLVREKVALSGDVTVTGFERRRGLIRVTLTKTDDPEQGSITLVFTDRPFELRQWVVVDPQSVATTITLNKMRTGLRLDPKLFKFIAPKRDDSIE